MPSKFIDNCTQYPNQVWKLPTWDGWIVVANGMKRVEEIGKASDEYLSGVIAFASVCFFAHCVISSL